MILVLKQFFKEGHHRNTSSRHILRAAYAAKELVRCQWKMVTFAQIFSQEEADRPDCPCVWTGRDVDGNIVCVALPRKDEIALPWTQPLIVRLNTVQWAACCGQSTCRTKKGVFTPCHIQSRCIVFSPTRNDCYWQWCHVNLKSCQCNDHTSTTRTSVIFFF